MQCPSCRSEIPDNQFYCPVCRASVYSYTPENVRSTNTRVERAGKRLLEVLLVLILIGIGIVLARAIKWNELVSNFLPGAVTATPTPKSDHPQNSQTDSSGKRKATDSSSPKTGEKKSADSPKPASAESTSVKKEEPSKSESKPAPKPEGQPTPKPPSSNN